MMKLLSLVPASARLCIVMCVGVVVGGFRPATAQSLSADIVTERDNATVAAGYLRARDQRVRIETPEFPNAFFLIDVAKPSAYFVRPAMHIYMDARQSSRLTRLFVPVDPDQPCRRWQAMAQLAGIAGQGDWRCERSGEEVIDGRKTVIFRVTSGSGQDAGQDAGQDYLGWIDPSWKFPLRIKTKDGTTIALENIRGDAQPESLFELPTGLRKFDPGALIEQIRQSDVWVGKQDDGVSSRR